jgi:uncharacterized membrane protein
VSSLLRELDVTEIRRGLAETRRFLLSHHEPSEHYRCHAVRVRGRRVHLCARCSGVYPGIALGAVGHSLGPDAAVVLLLVGVLPLPALVDWAITSFTHRRGHNAVRTATGLLLGVGYGLGLMRLADGWNLAVVAIGLVYGALAALLLAVDRS